MSASRIETTAGADCAEPQTAAVTQTDDWSTWTIPASRIVRSPLKRFLYFMLALISLGVAILGVFLPGLPSTEFVLLATWAAARSSPRLHAWLYRSKLFGPALYNWHNGRRVSRGAKCWASFTMTLCAVLMVRSIPHAWLVWPAIACMACVLIWLWRRPEPTLRLRQDVA